MTFSQNIQSIELTFPLQNEVRSFKTSSFDYEMALVYDESFTAHSGRIFLPMRGFRFRADFYYERCVEPAVIADIWELFQKEFVDHQGDRVIMKVGNVASVEGDTIDIVPESKSYQSRYRNTVQSFLTRFTVQSRVIFSNIQALAQAFVIDEAGNFVVDELNQKLIISI